MESRPTRTAFNLVLLLILIGCSACGGEQSTSYSLDWLSGAENRFDARFEGTLEGTLTGAAHFRTNERGQLVGLELAHDQDSARGLSFEMEPRALSPRTYEVIPSSLMHVDRPGSPVGFVAYYVDGQRSFTAVRGTLMLKTVDASVVSGRFSVEMDGRVAPDHRVRDDLKLSGSFSATPLADS